MHKLSTVSVFAAAAALICTPAHAGPVTIKLATLAPEGSTWIEVIRGANADIKAKTHGNVEIRVYPGGVAGDEPDVFLKMKLGQYHAAGFTGVGLGQILPEIRILELPFFYRNIDELDYVRDQLTPELEAKFQEKGQILLGYAEPGLVYFLAQKPIHGLDDMRGVKLWAWEGDPLAASLIRAFNVTPVNIALPDVLMALQTGMVNAVYAPPLAAMALQWHTKVKFLVNEPITNSTGAVLVTKKKWDEIAPADQVIIKDICRTALAKLTSETRRQNVEAIEKFRQLGVKIEPVSAAGHEEMVRAAAQIRTDLTGKLYSAELLEKVDTLLADFRSKHAGKK